VSKLIPKGRLGVSRWVEILLDKYASQRPTERLLESLRLKPWALAWLRRIRDLYIEARHPEAKTTGPTQEPDSS
jgi:hypothetical protein